MKLGTVIVLIAISAAAIFVYTQLTLFVVQPIGAIPEGRTLVIWKREKTHFIDSADAFCQREVGGVNLLCRAGALAAIGGNPDGIIARLPYSKTLYLISTDGTEFER